MILRLFVRITEENFRYGELSSLTEADNMHCYIYDGLNSTFLS